VPPAGDRGHLTGRAASILLCADADAASADLASGRLACPSCATGRLRSWGYGRERVIRVNGGTRRLRPRCRSCRATHVLLPSWTVPRRADSAGVIARAAALSALRGAGSARLGAELGVPAATARGWLRRLRAGVIR
jgi:transposase-like protein